MLRIIPAYAGSTDAVLLRVAFLSDHPRIRGEHRPWLRRIVGVIGIIPAYAGSTQHASNRPVIAEDHPRIRGEHRGVKQYASKKAGSSPHTRGAQMRVERENNQAGIIPAYAGSTRFIEDDSEEDEDHPRIRGEHVRCPSFPDGRRGSSPHTRGARLRKDSVRDWAGIIPAYAGSTSPDEAIPMKGGIIPAYAGSTTRARWRTGRRWDHPRIRGEHGIDKDQHTQAMRIIPAYAGSTSWRPVPS